MKDQTNCSAIIFNWNMLVFNEGLLTGFWGWQKGLIDHIFPCRHFQIGSKDTERIQCYGMQRFQRLVNIIKVITIGWRIRQTAIDLLFIIETCWFWTEGFWQDFEVGRKGLGGHIFPCRPFQRGSKDLERIQSKDLQRIQRLGNIIQCMV